MYCVFNKMKSELFSKQNDNLALRLTLCQLNEWEKKKDFSLIIPILSSYIRPRKTKFNGKSPEWNHYFFMYEVVHHVELQEKDQR